MLSTTPSALWQSPRKIAATRINRARITAKREAFLSVSAVKIACSQWLPAECWPGLRLTTLRNHFYLGTLSLIAAATWGDKFFSFGNQMPAMR
jgi:hypothetical protein